MSTKDWIDRSAQYQRDYFNYFGDQVGIPDDRMHIINEGPIGGIYFKGYLIPRRSRLVIDLVHNCFITVVFYGYYETWKDDKEKWVISRWYGGSIMPSDGSGPFELRDGPGSMVLPTIRRLLEIDQERPLTYDDIRSVIKGPFLGAP